MYVLNTALSRATSFVQGTGEIQSRATSLVQGTGEIQSRATSLVHEGQDRFKPHHSLLSTYSRCCERAESEEGTRRG